MRLASKNKLFYGMLLKWLQSKTALRADGAKQASSLVNNTSNKIWLKIIILLHILEISQD